MQDNSPQSHLYQDNYIFTKRNKFSVQKWKVEGTIAQCNLVHNVLDFLQFYWVKQVYEYMYMVS